MARLRVPGQLLLLGGPSGLQLCLQLPFLLQLCLQLPLLLQLCLQLPFLLQLEGVLEELWQEALWNLSYQMLWIPPPVPTPTSSIQQHL